MASTSQMVDKPPKINGIDKWEVESAADTLRRAFEIKADKKLFKAALQVIRERQAADKKVQGWATNMKG